MICSFYDILVKARANGTLPLLQRAGALRGDYMMWLTIYETYLDEVEKGGHYGAVRRAVESLGGGG